MCLTRYAITFQTRSHINQRLATHLVKAGAGEFPSCPFLPPPPLLQINMRNEKKRQETTLQNCILKISYAVHPRWRQAQLRYKLILLKPYTLPVQSPSEGPVPRVLTRWANTSLEHKILLVTPLLCSFSNFCSTPL